MVSKVLLTMLFLEAHNIKVNTYAIYWDSTINK
jgi:hypothetical protein